MKLFAVFFLCAIILFSHVSPLSAGPILPRTSKSFVYYVYWSGIRAGKAELHFEQTAQGITISTHATSAAFLSLFYPVDDRSQTVLYANGYPKSSIIKINQGRHKRDKATFFEPWEKGGPQKVVYHNILDEEKKEFTFSRPAHDPLSAFYAMTKMPLTVGTSEYIDIFDTKKVWHTEIQVLGKENIRVQGRSFDTILVRPLLKSEGIFRKTGDILIWATDDDNRLPVMMKSKAVIGTFTVELAEGDF